MGGHFPPEEHEPEASDFEGSPSARSSKRSSVILVKQASFDETVNCYVEYRKSPRKVRFRAVTFSAGAVEIIPDAPPSSPNQDTPDILERSQSCGDLPLSRSPRPAQRRRSKSSEDRIMFALEALRASIANRVFRARRGSQTSDTHSESD